jgi:hypothetical protein
MDVTSSVPARGSPAAREANSNGRPEKWGLARHDAVPLPIFPPQREQASYPEVAMSEQRLPIHPYAEIFPPMIHPEFDRLCGDIAVNGLQDEIVLYEGKVLDGRHRYLACLARMVTPRFREYAGECGSPLSYVVSRNLHRRQLTESQRAFVAARLKPLFEEEARQRQLAGLKQGDHPPVSANLRKREKPEENASSAQKAAEAMQVSARSVEFADQVKKQGIPELVEAVARGELAVSAASRIARLPAEQQKEVLARIQNGLKPNQALAHTADARPSEDTVDDAGRPLPDQVKAIFQRRNELRALCRQMDALDREIARLGQATVGFFLDAARAQNHLRQAKQEVWAAQPAHVCPSCSGAESACALCRGQGWITAALYDKPPPTGSSAA